MKALALSRALDRLADACPEEREDKKILARFLAWHFKILSVQSSDSVLGDLPTMIQEAMECFRADTEPRIRQWRERYLQIANETEFPTLTEVGQLNALRMVTLFHLDELLDDAVGSDHETGSRILQYFMHQDEVLINELRLFLMRVGKNGFLDHVARQSLKSYQCTIGRTHVRTTRSHAENTEWLDVTFSRGDTYSVTGEVLDVRILLSNAHIVYLQRVDTEFITAMDMIKDVTDNWPANPTRQCELLSPVAHVTIH